MFNIVYTCQICGLEVGNPKNMLCPICYGELRGTGGPGLTGTRDGFGIGRKFYHNDGQSTKEITTWKGWERAGYKDAISATGNKTIAKMAKDKMKRIKQSGGRSML